MPKLSTHIHIKLSINIVAFFLRYMTNDGSKVLNEIISTFFKVERTFVGCSKKLIRSGNKKLTQSI
jgi:hypothetical protein